RAQLPNEAEEIDYLRLCALARLNQHAHLYQMLEDKLAAGFWYSEYILRASPSFAPLQGDAEFERLVQKNIDRAKTDVRESVLLSVRPRGDAQPYSSIVALHGNGHGMREAHGAGQAAGAQGLLE